MSRPVAWPAWAPHMRGFWAEPPLGRGEVVEGAWGFARVAGVVPVPALVVAKDPGRSWTWQFGLTRITHRVEPQHGGCRVAVDLAAPWPLETPTALTWGPVFALSLRRLAAIASRSGASE